jgi:hypothetical protein
VADINVTLSVVDGISADIQVGADPITANIGIGTVSRADEKVKYNTNDTVAGYLADKVIAGTGITLSEGTGVDVDKLKITSTALGTDEKVKYDTNDAASGFLSDKIVAGTGISLAEGTSGKTHDSAAGFLADKIIAGTGITLVEGTGGDVDKLVITSTAVGTDEKVKYDAGDSTAGYIADKIVAGTGISIAEGTAGNENKSVVTNSDLGSSAVSGHNIAFNHGNIHALNADAETAASIIALGIDEIEFAVIKGYMI